MPRWLTSKIPTAVRTAVCSLTTPEYSSGISHPPNSANFAPRATCRSCRADCLRAMAESYRSGDARPVPVGHPSPRAAALPSIVAVTTYTLRKGAADRTRTDLVVIGVATGKAGALRRGCPEPRRSRRRTAAGSRRCSRRWASPAGSGEVGAGPDQRRPQRRPAARRRARRQRAELTPRTRTPGRRRRRAQPRQRRLGRPRSAGGRRRPRARGGRRVPLRALPLRRATSRAPRSPPGRRRRRRGRRAQRGRPAARTSDRRARHAPTSSASRSTRARDWVNDPANVLPPTAFAERDRRRAAGTTRVTFELLDAEALAELGCGGILGVGQRLGEPALPGQAAPGDPADASRLGGPGRQGHHLRLRRPDHQARVAR